MKERKDRVDDALHATRAAAKEGYVPGGGVALIRTIEPSTSPQEGQGRREARLRHRRIEALEAPARQIVDQRRRRRRPRRREVLEARRRQHRLDASTGEYVDMVKAGIIDPALVAKSALINAASVAG